MSITWLGAAALAAILLFGAMGFRRGFIKEVVATFFIILALLISDALQPSVYNFLREKTPLYSTIQENCRELLATQIDSTAGIGRNAQEDLIEGLSIPSFLKDALLENNTAEGYKEAAVDTFSEYIAVSIAGMATRGLSFLGTYLLATVLLHLAMAALNLLAKLPLLHGVNKLAGALVGAAKGLLFVWLAMLLLAVFCNTEIGKAGVHLAEQDAFLSLFYQSGLPSKALLAVMG